MKQFIDHNGLWLANDKCETAEDVKSAMWRLGWIEDHYLDFFVGNSENNSAFDLLSYRWLEYSKKDGKEFVKLSMPAPYCYLMSLYMILFSIYDDANEPLYKQFYEIQKIFGTCNENRT